MSCMDETAARRLQAAADEILKVDQTQSEAQLRRHLGLPPRVSAAAIPIPDGPKLGRILTHDDVRAIVREEVERLLDVVPSIPGFKNGDSGLDATVKFATAAPGILGPCTAAESAQYAFALRQLLESLDGEIVVAALVGESKTDLLNPVRQEVDRVRKFLDGRIVMRPELGDFRGRALTVLNAFVDKLEATAQDHESSPSVGESGDPTVGDGQAAGGELSPSVAVPPRPPVHRLTSCRHY